MSKKPGASRSSSFSTRKRFFGADCSACGADSDTWRSTCDSIVTLLEKRVEKATPASARRPTLSIRHDPRLAAGDAGYVHQVRFFLLGQGSLTHGLCQIWHLARLAQGDEQAVH